MNKLTKLANAVGLIILGSTTLVAVCAITFPQLVKTLGNVEAHGSFYIGASEGTPASIDPAYRHPDLTQNDSVILDESKNTVAKVQ